MADISTFPTIRNVIESGDNIKSYIAGAAIKAGQLVAIHGTGVSRTVHPAVKGTTAAPVGVAIGDYAISKEVAVAGEGCIVWMANADGSTAIDAGHDVEDNDNAVGGTISEIPANSGAATAIYAYRVGVTIDDIAGGATGRVLLTLGKATVPNSS